MSLSVFNLRRFVTAAFSDKAQSWEKLPGDSVEAKLKSLSGEILALVKSGDIQNVIQLYALLLPSLPANYELSEEAEKGRKQLSTLSKEAAASQGKTTQLAHVIATRFGDNIDQFYAAIMGPAMKSLRTRYVGQLRGQYPAARFNEEKHEAFRSITKTRQRALPKEQQLVAQTRAALVRAVRAVIAAARDQYIRDAKQKVLALKAEMQAKYPQMTEDAFVALLWASVKGGVAQIVVTARDADGNEITVAPFDSDPDFAFKRKHSVLQMIYGDGQEQGIHAYWSQPKSITGEAKEMMQELWPTPAPIRKESLLNQLGYSKTAGAFTRGMDYWNLKDKDAEGNNFYRDGHNWNMLKELIIEFFPNGEGLGQIINSAVDTSTGKPVSSMENHTDGPSKALYSFWKTVCGNSMGRVRDCLMEAFKDDYINPEKGVNDPEGLTTLINSVGSSGEEDIDTTFIQNGYVLTTDSDRERQLFGILRGEFGLNPVPQHVEVPIMPDCPNTQVFLTDFVMPCDYYGGIDDDTAHPVVRENIAFVGEYFDNRRTMTVMLKNDLIAPNGTVVESAGTKIPSATRYACAAQWKRMTEAAVAEATGNKALFFTSTDLDDSSRRRIMAQLDQNSILYNTDRCSLEDPSCARAFHLLERHYATCKDQANCTARAYVATQNNTPQRAVRNFSVDEQYLMASLVRYRIKFGFAPAMRSSTHYNREFLYNLSELRKELTRQRTELWNQYQQAEDEAERERIIVEYNAVTSQLERLAQGELKAAYEQHRSSNDSYQKGLQTLTDMLARVRAGDESLTSKQIDETVKSLFFSKQERLEARQEEAKSIAASRTFNWKRTAARMAAGNLRRQ